MSLQVARNIKIQAGFNHEQTCLRCSSHEIAGLDGDAIPDFMWRGEKTWPEDVSYYAMAYVCQCKACKNYMLMIELDVVKNPSVSEEWINRYFWRSAAPENVEERLTILYKAKPEGPEQSWDAERTQTKEGALWRHYFGPFPAQGNHIDWKRAAKCIEQMFPVVVDCADQHGG